MLDSFVHRMETRDCATVSLWQAGLTLTSMPHRERDTFALKACYSALFRAGHLERFEQK